MNIYKFLVIALMLAVNALFAAFEMALASVSRSRLVVLADQKRRGAKVALSMKNRMEASLAVVQVGITLAGAIAAAVGGVGIEETLSPWLTRVFGLSDTLADAVAVVAFVLPLSTVTIVFGELVPKMVAIKNPEMVCLRMAPAMGALSMVLFPVVSLLERVVKAVMAGGKRLAGSPGPAQDPQSLHELRAAVAVARTARLIGAHEERILLSAAQLPSRSIDSIMVPAESMSVIGSESSLADALVHAHLDLHTRFPVCKEAGNPQSIEGYVTFKDLVVSLRMEPRSAQVRAIMRPIRRFRGSDSIARVLESMVRDKIHIALVESAGGEVLGMVTLEDIMEELVGEIEDEFDRLPTHMHKTESGWIVGGGVTVDAVTSAVLGTAPPQPVDLSRRTTIADWCARSLDRPVERGETVRLHGLQLHVRKLRRQRIAECFVARDADPAPRAAPGD